jgi:transposase
MRVQCHNAVNGFGAANSLSRRHPGNPTSADRHNRMDERGGCGVPLGSLAGTESRATRIRWRQRHRTLLGDGSAVEISYNCTRGNGKADCPCRGSLVVRAGCLRRDPLSGCVFVFRSRSGTAIRLLTYDGQGYWLLQKRLSKNRFHWWPEGDQPAKRLESYEAQLLLAAGDVSRIRAAPMCRRVDESN